MYKILCLILNLILFYVYTLERLVKKPSISSYDKRAVPPASLKCAISPSFVKNAKKFH